MVEESLISLYKLDLNPLGVNIIQYYHGEDTETIVFKNNAYEPITLKVEGFDSVSEASPEPKIVIGNTNGIVSSYLRQYNNLRAAEITRIQTRAKYFALPTAEQRTFGDPQIYQVNRASRVTGISVTLELQSILDVRKVQIPGRKFYKDRCPWVFKDSSCGYTGTAYTTCPNTFNGCKERFGVKAVLPFGGFPLIDQFKV